MTPLDKQILHPPQRGQQRHKITNVEAVLGLPLWRRAEGNRDDKTPVRLEMAHRQLHHIPDIPHILKDVSQYDRIKHQIFGILEHAHIEEPDPLAYKFRLLLKRVFRDLDHSRINIDPHSLEPVAGQQHRHNAHTGPHIQNTFTARL